MRSHQLVAVTGLIFATVSAGAFAEETSAPETVLRLSPGAGNPRNSEGDFIRLREGRILFVYTKFSGGGGDHDTAELVSRHSSDGGKTWSPTDRVVVANEAGLNVMSVSLLRLADGRIALFYLRKESLADCRPVVRFSSDEAKTWSRPAKVIADDDIGYFVMNNDRVVQLKSGRLVAPVALHNRPAWDKPQWQGEITCYLSDDVGKTWRRSTTTQQAHDADGNRITAQEPGVVELADGRLLLWVRTDAGEQYRSYSSDGGDTWTPPAPMGIASPVSPASIERIPSTGELLLVWNNHAHLPIEKRKTRTPLSVAISGDEGMSWESVRNLDENPRGWFCYTAIEFTDDHVLLGHVAVGRRKKPHDHFFWLLGKGKNAQWAVRQGHWKLLGNATDKTDRQKPITVDKLFLANLQDDIGEQTNVAKQHPGVVKDLQAVMQEHHDEIYSKR